MHILMVTASFPYPLASGGAIRIFGLIKGLHDAGHQISLMSFADHVMDEHPLAQLCDDIILFPTPPHSRLKRIQTLLLTQRADIETRFYDVGFEAALLDFIESRNFDLIQFEAIEAAAYLLAVRRAFPQQKISFDTFNAEAELQRTIYKIDRDQPRRYLQAAYSWVQSRRIARYERALCRAADIVIAVSPEDHAILSTYRHDHQTFVVPSGIFVDDYQPISSSMTLPKQAVVFTGKMDYRPNVDAMLWFTDEILPLLKTIHLVIVGQKPHQRIQHLPQHKQITLTGWVDTILPYLYACDVYIAPLRMGSGTRLKLLEAMAAGCAIVATSIAASGLSENAKNTMIIADDSKAFARAIQSLLNDPHHRRQLGEQAHATVSATYDWSVIIPKLLIAYRELGLE